MIQVTNIFQKEDKFFRRKPLQGTFYCEPRKPEEEPAMEEIEITVVEEKSKDGVAGRCHEIEIPAGDSFSVKAGPPGKSFAIPSGKVPVDDIIQLVENGHSIDDIIKLRDAGVI